MYFSKTNGDDSLPFEFRHPAELDQLISHGLDSRVVFVRKGKKQRLVPKEVIPEVIKDGKVVANELTVYKTKVLPGLVYGYSVALLVRTSRMNRAVMRAALGFKLEGHAREPFVSSVHSAPETRLTKAKLLDDFFKSAQTLIGNMHGFMGEPNGPARHCRSAIIFVDDRYYELAERAFAKAFAQTGTASDKVYRIAGVRKRVTLTCENEQVA